MIIPMNKFSFLIFHANYDDFLAKIQEIGVLHVIEKKFDISEDLASKTLLIKQFEKAIAFLNKREPKEIENKNFELKEGRKLLNDILAKQSRQEELKNHLDSLKKELHTVEPWGEFSLDKIKDLEKNNIFLNFIKLVLKNLILKN
ncbi:MAG: hypothetical protein JXL97_03250 [Bacteroidales bacterium]|nr:hypothetical protein [Bacteroidales bacterium]